MKHSSSKNMFTLRDDQQQRLLACRAAWEEGEDEERLERLRLREEDAEIVRAFGQILTDARFAQGLNLTYAQMAQVLVLARALAPNPNLDARLLRRPGEPDALNHDLRDLLYGQGSIAVRLRGFLSRRHAGGQTALQLLCAAQPETWPLITQAGLRGLQLSPLQQNAALQTARERFSLPDEIIGIESFSNRPVHVGVPDNDPVLRLLADVIVYEVVCETLEAVDYLSVHRLLTRCLGSKTGSLTGGTAARGRRAALFYSPTIAPNSSSDPETGRREPAVTSKGEKNFRDTRSVSVHEPERPPYEAKPPSSDFSSASGSNFSAEVSAENVEANKLAVPPPVDITGYTQSTLLTVLEREIAAQGFVYPPLTVRDYYLCLQSKPFVLLSGLSGTGKTQLTSLFANVLTGTPVSQNLTQYRLLPVRPDWTDSTPILGYVNLLAASPTGRGAFVSTPFLDFLQRALRPANANHAYFICLDEMNLARVEHYFAEMLSAMETTTRELLLPDGRLLRLPSNFFITGTLNQDEATHSLSRKVLDRANTLTFQDVSLRETAIFRPSEKDKSEKDKAEDKAEAAEDKEDKNEAKREEEAASSVMELNAIKLNSEMEAALTPAIRQALFLQARVGSVGAAREKLRQVSPADKDFATYVVNVLADVNGFLEPHGLHFAYRVRDEALRYCANSFDVDGCGLLTPHTLHDAPANLRTALDLQLLQKVLPRLTGTLDQLAAPLTDLLRYAERQQFTQTALRLRRLQARLQRDGFSSFDTV